jgi:hypothetical protein
MVLSATPSSRTQAKSGLANDIIRNIGVGTVGSEIASISAPRRSPDPAAPPLSLWERVRVRASDVGEGKGEGPALSPRRRLLLELYAPSASKPPDQW